MFFSQKNIIFLISFFSSIQIDLLALTTPAIQVRIPWPNQEGLLDSRITVSVCLNLNDRAVQNIGKSNNFLYSNEDINLFLKTEGGICLIIVGGDDKNFFESNEILSKPISFNQFTNQVFQEEENSSQSDSKLFVIIRRFIIFAAVMTIIETFFKFSSINGKNFYLTLSNLNLLNQPALISNLKNNYRQHLLNLIEYLEDLKDQRIEKASRLNSMLRNSNTEILTSEHCTSERESINERANSIIFESSSDYLRSTGPSVSQPIRNCDLFTRPEPSFDSSDITLQLLDLHGKAIITEQVIAYLYQELETALASVKLDEKTQQAEIASSELAMTQSSQTFSEIIKKPRRSLCCCSCLRVLANKLCCCCPCACYKK